MEPASAVAALVALGSLVLNFVLYRRKTAAETDHLIVQSAQDAVETMRVVLEANSRRISGLQGLIQYHQQEIEELQGKLRRWEAKFNELGVQPPNGHDKSEPPEIHVAPV